MTTAEMGVDRVEIVAELFGAELDGGGRACQLLAHLVEAGDGMLERGRHVLADSVPSGDRRPSESTDWVT